MTLAEITAIVNPTAWPVTVLIIVLLLRRELAGVFGRVREIEGPGDLRVSLDPNKVEEIIKEGREEKISAAAIAQRIVRSALMDPLEKRILRALLDDDGRAIYSYQTDYYRRALQALIEKGYVRKVDKGFALTVKGRQVTKEYLEGVLQSLEVTEPAP
jgi:hypothetical protein